MSLMGPISMCSTAYFWIISCPWTHSVVKTDKKKDNTKNLIPLYNAFMLRCVRKKKHLSSGTGRIIIHLVPMRATLKNTQTLAELHLQCRAEKPPKLKERIRSMSSRRVKQGVHLSLKSHLPEDENITVILITQNNPWCKHRYNTSG